MVEARDGICGNADLQGILDGARARAEAALDAFIFFLDNGVTKEEWAASVERMYAEADMSTTLTNCCNRVMHVEKMEPFTGIAQE